MYDVCMIIVSLARLCLHPCILYNLRWCCASFLTYHMTTDIAFLANLQADLHLPERLTLYAWTHCLATVSDPAGTDFIFACLVVALVAMCLWHLIPMAIWQEVAYIGTVGEWLGCNQSYAIPCDWLLHGLHHCITVVHAGCVCGWGRSYKYGIRPVGRCS